MKFWPLSAVAEIVPSVYAAELQQVATKLPSHGAFFAAIDASRTMQPVHAPNLVIIESVDGPNVRAYTGRPEALEWSRLERAAVMETDDGYVFVLQDVLQ